MCEAVKTIRLIIYVKRVLCRVSILISVKLEKCAWILIGWKWSSTNSRLEASRLHLPSLFIHKSSVTEYETFVWTTVLGLTASNTQRDTEIRASEQTVIVTTRIFLHSSTIAYMSHHINVYPYNEATLCYPCFIHWLALWHFQTKIQPITRIIRHNHIG